MPEACFHCRGDVTSGQVFAPHGDRPRPLLRSRDRPNQLGTPCTDQTGQADHFTRVQGEAHVLHKISGGDAADSQQLGSTLLAGSGLSRELLAEFPTDHEANEFVLMSIGGNLSDSLAVTKDDHRVPDASNFVQVVADEHHAHSTGLELVDHSKQGFAFGARESSRGFVQDEYPGV